MLLKKGVVIKVENLYDMIIVGGGPAGLTAAIYMSRAKYKTLVIEKEKFGGQITITSEVVNYPGVVRTSGVALTNDMKKQAENFGAEFKLSEVLEMKLDEDIKTIKTTSGEYKALAVILALGASPRQIGFTGEKDFQGRGVAYCATCDGEFFTGMPVYVVGGGFAAVEESIFLTKYASKIDLLVRGENFSCAKTVSDHLEDEPKITTHFETEVVSISGDNTLHTIVFKNRKTGEITTKTHENGFGVFVFAGYEPNTNWLNNVVELDKGYITTDSNKMTNIEGVYAAGDVCTKNLRQVVTAVSDGAIAATSAEKYVVGLHSKLNIPAFEVEAKEIKEEIKEDSEKSNNYEVSEEESFIDSAMRAQLVQVFARFENEVVIHGYLDDSELAKEMEGFMGEIKGISDKVLCKASKISEERAPYLQIEKTDGASTGIRFYAMPGGHEFNSFVLSLYNVAGPGQAIELEDEEKINAISKDIDIKVLISLSCTMCPEVVVGTGKIASLNNNINANIIDISHFPDIKEKYNVMSVPCMVVNDKDVYFGKKSISQIIEIIEKI